ncbi:hypothetical protein [Virgibacillus sp. MG-45]|uniref:hypothetical protein n=1 Tax=Virgibacillus sp. MG-45 TaxID=3102791 RepID=UPI002EDB3124
MDFKQLKEVTRLLEEQHISYALGGSGLLYSLGLTKTVNDWDITTDASEKEITTALKEIPFHKAKVGTYPFVSPFLLQIPSSPMPIEIIGRFSIFTAEGKVCPIPTIHTFTWQGIKIGSPEAWYVAYTLMQREEKAKILLHYLQEKGVSSTSIDELLKTPLPESITSTLKRLLN